MSDNSKIEWLAREGTKPATWNPITGCTKISEGCRNCYAERMAKRLAGRFGYPADEPFRVTWHEDRLTEPFRWRKPRTVFVVSMGDLFHKDVSFDWILRIWSVMFYAIDHTFLVLTKRPERMAVFLNEWLPGAWQLALLEPYPGPFANVWLGITAENQQRADERIPLLLQCPAAVRFVSIEPMLGAVDLRTVKDTGWKDNPRWHPGQPIGTIDTLNRIRWPIPVAKGTVSRPLDWVIVGGESGPGARPMHPDWARSVRDQCQSAGVPFFFKQMSKRAPIPDDLMIREWPTV